MKRRKQKVIELTQGLPRPKVFLQIGEAPIVTVGKGSFADDLIRLAGGENIAGEKKEMYPRLGMEEILKRSPEVILISSMNPKGDYQRMLQEWARWKMIPAVKNGRISPDRLRPDRSAVTQNHRWIGGDRPDSSSGKI